MNNSNTQPTRSFKVRRWGCASVIVLFLIVSFFLLRGSETKQERVLIGDQWVDVTMKISFWRGPAMDHTGISIGEDYYTYKVTLNFPNRKSITFRTEAQPEAIWYLDKQLFFVGRGPTYWLTAKLHEDGTLTPISKKDLPPGPRPWNFGNLTPEQQKGMEHFYQVLAH